MKIENMWFASFQIFPWVIHESEIRLDVKSKFSISLKTLISFPIPHHKP